jgi:hypothetical protein
VAPQQDAGALGLNILTRPFHLQPDMNCRNTWVVQIIQAIVRNCTIVFGGAGVLPGNAGRGFGPRTLVGTAALTPRRQPAPTHGVRGLAGSASSTPKVQQQTKTAFGKATIICLSFIILYSGLSLAADQDTNESSAAEIATNNIVETAELDAEPSSDASSSNATTQVEIPSVSTDQPAHVNRLDVWHDLLSSRLIRTAERFDHYFGDDPSDDEQNGTLVQVGIGAKFDTEDIASFEKAMKARIKLPVLENRLHLLVDNLTESQPDANESIAGASKDVRPNTALSYLFQEHRDFRLSLDAGLKLGGPIDPSLRLRGSRTWSIGRWELLCRQTFRWFQVESYSETSEIKWSRPFGDSWLFESNSRLTWEQQYNGVTPAQILAWSKELSSRRTYKIELAAVWPQTPHPTERDYTVAMGYRQLIHSDWMFIELSPQVEFAEVNDYTPVTSLIVLFDFMFGNVQ